MTQTIVEIKARPKTDKEEGLLNARADFMTPWGALLLGVTIVLTVFFLLALFIPVLDGLQMIIVALLTMGSWLYLINRFSERLQLDDGVLEFNCALGRKHRFDLSEISSIRLNDMGWTLSGDFYVLQIEVFNRDDVIELGLGPCWRRSHLTSFVRSVGSALNNIR